MVRGREGSRRLANQQGSIKCLVETVLARYTGQLFTLFKTKFPSPWIYNSNSILRLFLPLAFLPCMTLAWEREGGQCIKCSSSHIFELPLQKEWFFKMFLFFFERFSSSTFIEETFLAPLWQRRFSSSPFAGDSLFLFYQGSHLLQVHFDSRGEDSEDVHCPGRSP